VDDVDARMGAAAGREGDGDEPPLRLLLAHGHGSSDTMSVQSGQPAALDFGKRVPMGAGEEARVRVSRRGGGRETE
jgi:hypothetical protein